MLKCLYSYENICLYSYENITMKKVKRKAVFSELDNYETNALRLQYVLQSTTVKTQREVCIPQPLTGVEHTNFQFYSVFTRYEDFCMEWKQKQKVDFFGRKLQSSLEPPRYRYRHVWDQLKMFRHLCSAKVISRILDDSFYFIK